MKTRRAWLRRAGLTLGLIAIALAGLSWPSPAKSAPACKAPELRVFKAQGELELVCAGQVTRTMSATFGANPVGPKEQEGDERTPEGVYTITSKTKSDRFHRFLAVSYPNDEDRRNAKSKGITRIGGGIGIHGVRRDLASPARAWTRFARVTGLAGVWGPTDGCVGLANEDVEILYDLVPAGTRVTIAP
jgi:murein L,D-transpeptidase YafK